MVCVTYPASMTLCNGCNWRGKEPASGLMVLWMQIGVGSKVLPTSGLGPLDAGSRWTGAYVPGKQCLEVREDGKR